MKKKFLSLIVIIAIAVSLAACGSTPEHGGLEEELAQGSAAIEQEMDISEEPAEDREQESDEQEVFAEVIPDGTMTVHFLDVGQGNAILVEQSGRYMLIDGGDNDTASYVVAYLKEQGVETLDYMIVSHYDSDHLSGCVGAMRVFDVETVLCPDYVGDTKTYDTFVNDLEASDITCIHPQVGETYSFGDAAFTVVCPEASAYSDENDNSVGIRLVYGQNSFLICGDAGEESEEDMLKSGIHLQSEVYLASHHGSGGSSTYDFLQAVQPKTVVVSAGFDNSYGHPSKATMNRLKNTGADLYRTDLQGELVAVSDGSSITWNVGPTGDFRCGEDVVKAKTADIVGDVNLTTYILNINSGKFHIPSCSSVDDMAESNKKEVQSSLSEMEARGYSACKRCLK